MLANAQVFDTDWSQTI